MTTVPHGKIILSAGLVWNSANGVAMDTYSASGIQASFSDTKKEPCNEEAVEVPHYAHQSHHRSPL